MSSKNCGPDIVKYFVVEPGGSTTGSTQNTFVTGSTLSGNTLVLSLI
jgi:hypothetical protein